ncbi:MAG TPA: Rpn family recombination-promoting nuclease/putative transposase [Thermoanaerobaculia bacterium]|nr:Rpn family recombination-promoting nuclease/putative transposase [Thermoanaerobaculia bacterium]
MGQHDLSYRLFFSHARMVCDLLREMIGEDWVKLLDFASAERVNASFVSETRRNRESDVIWKFRRRDSGDPVYVYVLLEFQSRPDRYMPVRLMTYTGLFYEHLIAEGRLPPSGRLPQLIPIVLYNGLGPWGTPLDLAELIERFDPSAETYVPHLRYKLLHEAAYSAEELEKQSPVADLFRLERSASWNDVLVGVERLKEHVGLDEEPELYRAFVGWLREVIFPRLGVPPAEVPQGLTLEEFEPMLAERIDSWNEQQRQKGRQEGLQQGLQEGLQQGRKEEAARILLRLLEKRFGAVHQATRDRIAAADADLLLEWIDRFPTADSLAEIFSG